MSLTWLHAEMADEPTHEKYRELCERHYLRQRHAAQRADSSCCESASGREAGVQSLFLIYFKPILLLRCPFLLYLQDIPRASLFFLTLTVFFLTSCLFLTSSSEF